MSTTVLKSNQVTFVDTTDARKLEVYIASNLPTVQIYNVNNKTYSPDWSAGENLKLTASVFLDSREITTNDIEWYRQSETQPFATGVLATISTNEMSNNAIMTYFCKAKYQGIEASAQISFARNDTGTNGTSAPPVMARYSVDGETNWESKFNSTTHKFIQYSYDGGKSWDVAIKIVGDNGTSVNIKGTASSVEPSTSNPSYYIIKYNSIEITEAKLGDAYLFDGNLYVCVDARDGQDYFMDAGRIQGPSGANGTSSFVHIKYAPVNPNDSNMTNDPDDTTVYIGIYVGEEASPPTTKSSYKWSKFIGESAKMLILNGDSQVFRVDKNNVYTPGKIKISAQKINIPTATSLSWYYNANNNGWNDLTATTNLLGVKLDTSMGIVEITGSSLKSNFIAIKVSDGTIEDILTIYKAFDGADGTPASMTFLTNENISFSANESGQVKATTFETSVVAYTGTAKVIPTVDLNAISGLPTGMTLSSSEIKSDEMILKFAISDNSKLGSDASNNGIIAIPIKSPVETELKLSWSKINAGVKGADGVGINSTQVRYGTTESASIKPADDKWSDAIPEVPDGHYLWTRTIIDYTDPNKNDTVTYTYAKQGKDGETGSPGTSVTVESIQYKDGTSATSAPSGDWYDYVVPVAEGSYLWTKTILLDGKEKKTVYSVAKQGTKGNTGDKGADAYTVLLTNESHVFAGDVSSAIAGEVSTQVVAYVGSTSQNATIVSVDGVNASTSETNTKTSGLTFQCDMLTGASPKITFKCTTSFTSKNGAIPIVVKVGNLTFTKMFTYSIAFKGNAGNPATSYWLVSSASVVQKTAVGTIAITPSTLTFTSKSQTGTNTPTDYACRWIIAYSTDGSTYTDLYTSTTNEASKAISVTTAYKTIRARMYLAGGTATLLDEQIIPVVSDGASVKSTTVTYGVSTSASTQPTSWYPTVQTAAEGSYLWTKTITDYTDDSITDTVIYTYAKQGKTPVKGTDYVDGTSVTVSSIQYQAGISATTAPTGTWSDSVVSVAEGSYLWTKTTFSDGKIAYGVAKQGQKGSDAYTVILTNESHIFAGTVSAAVASSATTQVLAYKGTAAQSVTIVSVNGVTAATASTATGIAGLSFACSALSGTSPTITFTCTTSFVSANGSIPIVLSVDGVSVTKMFTYSIAFKGNTGAPSTSYWLVSNANAVQKTSNGDILCTPATLTFTGRSQSGTSAPANYAGRWILAYSTDGSTYTDSYTSTANEATVSIASSPTYKAIRARMYLAGGTATLLDEQIIPFVSDGETGGIGEPGVTFQVYSNNGYALSTSTPTILLQTFAYIGDVEIKAGATYQWYKYENASWVAISGATNSYFYVSRDNVSFSNNYMCKMQLTDKGTEYVGVVTVDDKSDENKIFASKPSNYFAGDLWIVGSDYIPSGFKSGTMLRAQHTNSTYQDSDWVSATRYDDEINSLSETVGVYKQYFSADSTNGLRVGDASINNNTLTVDRINTTTINAREMKMESPLTVSGKYSGSTMIQAPIINIGNFSIVVESNGSLSIVSNT